MKYKFDFIEWQWVWKLHKPWAHFHEADEDGPAEIFFGAGPFQFRGYMWYDNTASTS